MKELKNLKKMSELAPLLPHELPKQNHEMSTGLYSYSGMQQSIRVLYCYIQKLEKRIEELEKKNGVG